MGPGAKRFLVVLVALLLGAAGWYVFGRERRARRTAVQAHAQATRDELQQSLALAEDFRKGLEVCRQARLRGARVPRECDEAGRDQGQVLAEARKAEQGYLEACRLCAPADACQRDLDGLKESPASGRAGRTPCD
jgi:hypothetical protein